MAGRYQAYPEYKNSRIEWLGAVPKDWQVLPCRAAVANKVDKNEGAIDQNYLSLMANIGVIKYEDKGDVGNKKPDDLSKCKIIKKGNLVINSMNYSIGSYGMSEYDGVCSPVYIVLEPDERVIRRRFALRLFENRPFQQFLASFGNGILEHRAAIGWDDIKGAYIPVPSKDEQLEILNFLDHETAKIDRLIENQQQLIVLLKEKRQAVISHAVTKGLDPNVKMKDTGVEWLGRVPEHWDVSLLKYKAVNITDGAHISPELDGGVRYFVSIKDLEGDVIDFENAVLTSEENYKYLVKTGCKPSKGDILFSKDGSVGKTVVVRTDEDFVVASSLIIVKPNKKRVGSDYLNYLCKASVVQEQVNSFVKGAALKRLSIQNLLKVFGVFPPLSEQQEIVGFLDEKLRRYSILEEKAQRAVNLLSESRLALISDTVTGKIDVRNWCADTKTAA